jgi:hypothetical protein
MFDPNVTRLLQALERLLAEESRGTRATAPRAAPKRHPTCVRFLCGSCAVLERGPRGKRHLDLADLGLRYLAQQGLEQEQEDFLGVDLPSGQL